MAGYRYYEGRPQAHRDLQLLALSNLPGCCGCLALLILAVNFLGLVFVPSVINVLLVVVANLIFGFLMWPVPSTVRSIRRDRGQIVPYFKKPTDHSLGDAWLSGRALSRNCQRLDELGIRLGVQPLSHFGFADDMRGETVVWHEPKEALVTTRALLEALESADCAGQRDELREDLVKLQAALEKAQANGNQFALLVNFEEGWISGPEVEQRQGSYY
jgi:hypothetical protein